VNRGQKEVEGIHGINLEGMSSVSLDDKVDICQTTLPPTEIKLRFPVA
jgi:hypothetical protein